MGESHLKDNRKTSPFLYVGKEGSENRPFEILAQGQHFDPIPLASGQDLKSVRAYVQTLKTGEENMTNVKSIRGLKCSQYQKNTGAIFSPSLAFCFVIFSSCDA
jgi:hypothetical protein